jgi:hypothetical protein
VVDQAGPGDLAATERLGDPAVDGQVPGLQAVQPVIGRRGELVELLGQVKAIQSSRRRGVAAEQEASAMRR